jgi:hypothetical protein
VKEVPVMVERDELARWPSVADVCRDEQVTFAYVYRLLHRGTLAGIHTRVGWLLDPQSVAAWAVSRHRKEESPSASA